MSRERHTKKKKRKMYFATHSQQLLRSMNARELTLGIFNRVPPPPYQQQHHILHSSHWFQYNVVWFFNFSINERRRIVRLAIELSNDVILFVLMLFFLCWSKNLFLVKIVEVFISVLFFYWWYIHFHNNGALLVIIFKALDNNHSCYLEVLIIFSKRKY